MNRLISYIKHTCVDKQYSNVGNTAKQCRLGLFQNSDFAEDLEDSKSTSDGTLCVLGDHTFVPMIWICEKTNFRFAQFNRVINYFLGRRIEIGRKTALDFMGSDRRSSSRKHVLTSFRTGRLVKEQTWSSFTSSHNSKNQKNLMQWLMI